MTPISSAAAAPKTFVATAFLILALAAWADAPSAQPARGGQWSTTVIYANGTTSLHALRDQGWPVTVHKQPPKSPIATASIDRTLRPAPRQHGLEGIASYYWQDQMTANGERFDKRALTAAHRTLPFGTRVKVTNVVNGRSVVVRINDRGPFKPGRVIDLSLAAAEAIDMHRAGLVPVKVEVLP